MQVTREQLKPTLAKLSVKADQSDLDTVKQHVLKQLGAKVKVPGFRSGKAPDHLIEKQLDPNVLQSEFVEHAINDLYADAVAQEKIRPVAQPEVAVTKFVPFSALEFTAEVESIGDIKLADYKKIKLAPKKVEVEAGEIKTVVDNLRQRAAKKKGVQRAAKKGDEVTIDFKGVDAKTKAAISGAEGKEYPLVIGSKRFIPGFEEKLVGLKAGDKKTFKITFPADYGSKELQNKLVSFDVAVRQVQELEEPKADDAFAASVGPFKTLADLKKDIKRQIMAEKQREADRAYENELLEKIAAKSEVSVPDALIEQEIESIEQEDKRNVIYRGQTWQEHLDEEGVTAEEHRTKQRPIAEIRVKSGLILGAIAEAEAIEATDQEVELRIQLLKGQYRDQSMQSELDKPENKRDIRSRLMTEKTLDKLKAYATAS